MLAIDMLEITSYVRLLGLDRDELKNNVFLISFLLLFINYSLLLMLCFERFINPTIFGILLSTLFAGIVLCAFYCKILGRALGAQAPFSFRPHFNKRFLSCNELSSFEESIFQRISL